MNREHLQAFLWLRWRMSVNQWRRGGALNAVIMMIACVGLAVLAIPLFFGCLALGLYMFPKAAPAHLLYAWDGIVVGFLFFWVIGLITELQRTESLSMSKFLHLPVSVNGVFLINYLSSLMRVSLIVFVPVMLGFGLALAISRGGLLLCALLLTAAFLLMVTALTYQFQGWLASLMSNPRRRRTIIVVATGVFVLLFQLPNLLGVVRPWGLERRANESAKLVEELADLDRAFKAHEFDVREYQRRSQEAVKKRQLATQQSAREGSDHLQHVATLVNFVLPIGWLPLGVMAAADGKATPAVLGFLGMTLIGAVSLWRAYRTTIGLYQGRFTSRKRPKAPVVAPAARTRKPGARLVDMRLPWVAEPVSAIAAGGLQSLIRSPESKMMLLTPVFLGVLFGSMVTKVSASASDSIRTLLAVGAIVMALFGMLQLMANQFGFDRDGFRVLVLCAVPRRDILLGKNLAFAPLAVGMAAILLAIIEVVCPMRWDHLLSMAPQFISMFLLFCILMNFVSILAPMHIAAGSLKPTTVKLLPVLMQMAIVFCLLPLTQAPTLLPLGIEAALEHQGMSAGIPVCLLLSLIECAAVVCIYRFSLIWEGSFLQAREQRILETVTNR